MTTALPLCDICMGDDGVVISHTRLPRLILKHLQVQLHGPTPMCVNCARLLRLWEDFSRKAKRNLLIKHPIKKEKKKLQTEDVEEVTLEVEAGSRASVTSSCSRRSTQQTARSTTATPESPPGEEAEEQKPSADQDCMVVEDLPGEEEPEEKEPALPESPSEEQETCADEESLTTENLQEKPADDDSPSKDLTRAPVLVEFREPAASPGLVWQEEGAVDPLLIKQEPLDEQEQLPQEKLVACSDCSKRFHAVSALCLHTKYRHGVILDPETLQPVLFRCSVCQRKFPSREELACHRHDRAPQLSITTAIELGEDVPKYQCRVCRTRPSSRAALLDHFSEHRALMAKSNLGGALQSGQKSPPPRNKDSVLRETSNRQTEDTSQDPKTRHDPQDVNNLSPLNKRKVPCVECNIEFPSTKDFVQHFMKTHTESLKDPSTNEKSCMSDLPRKCGKCEVKFLTSEELSAHLLQEHKAMVRQAKPRRVTREVPDSDDEKSKCKEESPLKLTCQFCDLGFLSRQGLENHCSKTHGVSPSSAVSMSEQSAANTRGASKEGRQSLENQHNGAETPLSVASTSRRSSVSSESSCFVVSASEQPEAKDTRYTRRDGKLFCNFCMRSYISMAQMLRHVHSIHLPPLKSHQKRSRDGKFKKPNQQPKEVRCEDCDQYFMTDSELTNHVRMFHSGRRVIVRSSRPVAASPAAPPREAAGSPRVLHCHFCGKTRLTLNSMAFHMQSAHVNFGHHLM